MRCGRVSNVALVKMLAVANREPCKAMEPRACHSSARKSIFKGAVRTGQAAPLHV